MMRWLVLAMGHLHQPPPPPPTQSHPVSCVFPVWILLLLKCYLSCIWCTVFLVLQGCNFASWYHHRWLSKQNIMDLRKYLLIRTRSCTKLGVDASQFFIFNVPLCTRWTIWFHIGCFRRRFDWQGNLRCKEGWHSNSEGLWLGWRWVDRFLLWAISINHPLHSPSNPI